MNNPYLAPSDAVVPPPAGGYGLPGADHASEGRAGVSDATVEVMRQTKPWVVFMGVMSLLGAAFMLLGGLLMMVMGALVPKNGPLSPALIGLIYIPMGLVYVYPGLKLWKYGKAIGALVMSRSSSDLEEALGHQKSFWKFMGIATIIFIALYALFFVGMIIVGIASAGRMH